MQFRIPLSEGIQMALLAIGMIALGSGAAPSESGTPTYAVVAAICGIAVFALAALGVLMNHLWRRNLRGLQVALLVSIERGKSEIRWLQEAIEDTWGDDKEEIARVADERRQTVYLWHEDVRDRLAKSDWDEVWPAVRNPGDLPRTLGDLRSFSENQVERLNMVLTEVVGRITR